jgi:hypothetical protein
MFGWVIGGVYGGSESEGRMNKSVFFSVLFAKSDTFQFKPPFDLESTLMSQSYISTSQVVELGLHKNNLL